MSKKYIKLKEWADLNSWSFKKAKDSARQGKLKHVVVQKTVTVRRLFISADFKV